MPMTRLRQSRTRTVSVACAADQLYQFVSNPANFPTWVTSFVRSARQTEAGWILDTTEGDFGIAFTPENPYGVLDHVVTVAPGGRSRTRCVWYQTGRAARSCSRCFSGRT